ncbi:MAG: TDT family transporter [Lachnospiraceae bacterium]|nr:TDT family transporter [Lachnospiraceae bacterium]
MKFIKSIPMATCGISLSLAALGNLLLPLPYGARIRYGLGIFSFAVLILFLLKCFLDHAHAKEELKTPVPMSVLPTVTMASMLLTTYIRPHIPVVALFLWYCAVVIHICIILVFCKRFVFNFQRKNVFPSWFVQGVGMVTISVTAPAMGAVQIGQIVFYIGFVLYFIIFTLVVIRMNTVRTFPEPARKTVAIFTAPMSLLTVGYFNSFVFQDQSIPALVYFLLIGAAANYIYVTCMMFSLLKIKFYPTYAAFTFPYVISALAFRLGSDFLMERHRLTFLPAIANVTMWIAVAVVLFVLIHYIRYFRSQLKF